jgi:hypothetical protein
MVWFGWLSAISQLASRVGGRGGEGEWGSDLPISIHYLAQGEGQGGGLRSPSLTMTCILSAAQIYTQLHLHCAQLYLRKGTQAHIYTYNDTQQQGPGQLVCIVYS